MRFRDKRAHVKIMRMKRPRPALEPVGLATVGAFGLAGAVTGASLVDEIRSWSRARTPSELSKDWRRSVEDRAPGLVAHFALDEGEGDIVHDRLDPRYQFRLHRRQPDSWSPDNAPLDR
jgi:hypothetical protein